MLECAGLLALHFGLPACVMIPVAWLCTAALDHFRGTRAANLRITPKRRRRIP